MENQFDLGLNIASIETELPDPVITLTGADTLTASDTAEMPLLALTVNGRSWQNGTPSSDNAAPIENISDSGSMIVTTHGENLIDPSTVVIGGMDSATGDEITTGSRLRTGFIYVPYTGERTHIVPEGFVLVSVYRYDSNKNFLGFNYREEDCYLRFLYKKEDGSVITEEDLTAIRSGLMFSVKANADYEPYKSTTAAITTALPLRGIPVDSGGNYSDKNGKLWLCDTINYNYTSAVKQQRIAIIDSYNGEPVGSDYISTTGGLDVGATVIYPAETVTETLLTADEINQLRNLETFDGVTNIFNSENADMSVKYLTSKVISEAIMPIISALGG